MAPPGDGGGLLRLCGVWSVGSFICSMLERLVGGGGVAEVDRLFETHWARG